MNQNKKMNIKHVMIFLVCLNTCFVHGTTLCNFILFFFKKQSSFIKKHVNTCFFFIIGTIHIGHMLKKPLWLLMPYKNLIATWSKPDWSCQGSFCHPKHFPAMVSIKTSIQIEYQNEKAVVIPHDLLLGHEGQQFLKLRPTSYPIIRLLHGHNAPRNASLTQLKPLQDLIEARNQEIKKVQGEEDPSGTGNQNLFDQEDAEFVSKKRKYAAPISSVVTITVGQKQVDCLASGSKPTRSDFAVLLDPDHLEPVISHLRSSIAAALELPTINLKSKE